jgi:SAM-dependent methyltransferase
MNSIDSIDDNLSLSATSQEVDRINGGFYGKFPYPWRPRSIDCTADPDFARIMLNQNLGEWTHQAIPSNPHIWIGGCGTNQAAITALNFPNAVVRGSDVSTSSLEMCASTARELGCTNLELRNESINETDYAEQFDYIICTGVIHHNADPEATLKKLAKALKPAGVLELMVYNRYHRILTSAFQKGVRLLAGTESAFDYQRELTLTRSLIDDFPGGEGLMRHFAGNFKQSPDMVIADSLMQPVEYSYTVEVLEEMAIKCGLEFILPAPNSFDRGSGNVTWNLRFSQKEIQTMYDQLPDSLRWQITNLFLCENSPMLWFYLRKNNLTERKSEQQVCDSFLGTRFQPNSVARRSYVLTKDNKFSQVKSPLRYPGLPAKPELRKIVEAVGSGAPMERVLESLGVSRDFATVNDLRLRLTTSTSPFLRSTA